MADQVKKWIISVLGPLTAIALQILLTPHVESPNLMFYLSAVLISTAYAGKRFGMISAVILILSNLSPYLFGLEDQAAIYSDPLSTMIFTIEALVAIYIVDYFRKTDLLDQEKNKVRMLEQNTLTLEQKYRKVKKEIEIRDEFLSIASHELKTPLTSMVLQLQTALHNIRNVSLANFSVGNLLKMLEKAENQTKRLSRIINDLLDASRTSSKKLSLNKEEIDISELAADVVENFVEKAKKNGNKINLRTQDSVKGHWDKHHMEQAIGNLISNAIKYGDRKPVEVVVAKNDSHAFISVKDNGNGIDKADTKKIFKLFERVHENKSIEGTGVGLYITDRIVKAHGGKIAVKSKKGLGSEFTIHLPFGSDQH